MVNYNLTKATTNQQLEILYKNSAFTMEGLLEDSIPDLLKWMEEMNALTKETPTVWVFSGKLMNDTYDLTGDNRYPDDLTIVSIMGINQMKVAIPRFTIGARWFDDIVDNNKIREGVEANA